MASQNRLEFIANALSIPVARHHIFLCADQTNPKCASREETLELWRHLKARLKKLGITTPPPTWQNDPSATPEPEPTGRGSVLRSKVDCLRICEEGPICVVYPDGTWYSGLTVERLDRIIDQHLIGGQPVSELAFASGPLVGGESG